MRIKGVVFLKVEKIGAIEGNISGRAYLEESLEPSSP